MNIKKTIVVHPFLFAIFPILFLFSYNIEEISINEILIPTAIAIFFTFLLMSLLRFIFKDKIKTGLLVSFLILLFFSYGHFFNLLKDLPVVEFKNELQIHRYLLLALGVMFTISAYFIIKMRRDLHNSTNFLNIVAASLVVFSLINIGVYESKTISRWSQNNITTNTTDSESPNTSPDIYYIILDGYASSGTLKEIYNYDNHEFTDFLTNKGFYIPYESRSNYAVTFLSLASSLNMEYINYLSDTVGTESNDREVPYDKIYASKVLLFLKEKKVIILYASVQAGEQQMVLGQMQI